MGKQTARQRQLQQQGPTQQQQQASSSPEEGYDPVKAAKAKTLVLQTSAFVALTVVAVYFGLISDKLGLGIIAMMCLCLRFLAT